MGVLHFDMKVVIFLG